MGRLSRKRSVWSGERCCGRFVWPTLRVAAVAIALVGVPLVAGQVPSRSPGWLPAETGYDRPFFEGATYDASVKTPEQLLGFKPGMRPAFHQELERCLLDWQSSPRMTLHEYARSHEQRALYYAVITSPENHRRLERIRSAIGKLADPRKLDNDAQAQRIIRDTPAVAWLAYSIHGDETSGADAAVVVVHHLLASRDADVTRLLDELVIVIDPLMNPDGRDRYLSQLRQFGGYTPVLDNEGGQHAGRWPWGRGNHYLFDLNRDWILGVHPETRGRQKAVAAWQPQLFVDAHEMGAYDTYLFNPARAPFNPHMSPVFKKWWKTFAQGQAAAFDRYGWSYYTREWLEMWYPGYSDSWVMYHGAVGILYEQAGVGGSAIRRPAGDIMTYRESVHHQAVSSLANLRTLREQRTALLTDFLEQKRNALAVTKESPARTFLLAPSGNATRERVFLSNLHNQGIEVFVTQKAFTASSATDILGNTHASRQFPAGTYAVPFKQPAGPLVGAVLDFDPRMSASFLAEERKELETKRRTKVYDVTGWSLPMAYAVDGYWMDGNVPVATRPYVPAAVPQGAFPAARNAYAYVIGATDDSWFRALSHLLQDGVKVRFADRDFRAAGRAFARGSLLIRVHENDKKTLAARVRAAAESSGVSVYAVTTGLSADDGPDLGGRHFVLLQRPRVAMFGDLPISFNSYGAIWRLFDVDVGQPVSLLSVHDRGDTDFRRYNVVILPTVWGSAETTFGPLRDKLKKWVEAGGTLIAAGSAAEPLTHKEKGFSAVRRRRDVLDKLGEYAAATTRERAAGKSLPDPAKVWGQAEETPPTSAPADTAVKESGLTPEALDEWRRVFSPSGIIVRGELDTEHWLTVGCPSEMPLYFAGANVWLAKHPVQTPVRLAEREHLRLSGLLWAEATARIADSAYVTVERVGSGQVILFAADPDFRGYFHGSRRLLINAVLLGPGAGTSPAVPEP